MLSFQGGRVTGWSNKNRKLTNLTLQFLNVAVFNKRFLQIATRQKNSTSQNYNTTVEISYSCFVKTKKFTASIEVHKNVQKYIQDFLLTAIQPIRRELLGGGMPPPCPAVPVIT